MEGRLASPASSRGGEEEHVNEGGLDQKNGDGDRFDGLGLPLSTPTSPSSLGGEASTHGAASVGTARGDWILGMKLLSIPFLVVPLPTFLLSAIHPLPCRSTSLPPLCYPWIRLGRAETRQGGA